MRGEAVKSEEQGRMVRCPPKLIKMSNAELCTWLSRFLFEAKKVNGENYSEVSVYQIMCGLMQYLRENGRADIDFFSDRSFSTLCSAIDCRMKALRKAESVPRQTECLSEEDEELLWRKGLLGGDSPDSLHDTMVFMCGLFFALRGGGRSYRD